MDNQLGKNGECINEKNARDVLRERGGELSERGVNGWKKTRRFCKESKTFSQDILLILNRSVSVLSRLLSPSRSRFFFLNCRLPPSSARPRAPR